MLDLVTTLFDCLQDQVNMTPNLEFMVQKFSEMNPKTDLLYNVINKGAMSKKAVTFKFYSK